MEVFVHAFTIMPRNVSIALNLLQAITTKIKDKGLSMSTNPIMQKCIKTIENCELNEEQEQRYHKMRGVLDEII